MVEEDKFEMGKGWGLKDLGMDKGWKLKDFDMDIDPELRKEYPYMDDTILDTDSLIFIGREIAKAKLQGIRLKLSLSSEDRSNRTWELQRA